MKIAWISSDTRTDVASFRYRGLYPSFYLSDHGFANTYFSVADIDINRLKEYDVIVFIKTVNQSLTPLMRDLRIRYNRKVILDLCDYATHPEYGNKTGELRRVTILSQASYISAITVPTDHLRDVLMHSLGGQIPIVVIPDQEETEALVARTREFNAGRKPIKIFLRRLVRPRSLVIASIVRAKRLSLRTRQGMKDRWNLAGRLFGEVLKNPAMLALKAREKIRRRRSVLSGGKPSIAAPSVKDGATGRDRRSDQRKQLIWFGNAGSDSFQSGIQTLTLIAPELIRLAQEVDFELIVMSNRSEAYKALIEPLPFRSRFEFWTQEKCFEQVRASHAFLMPQIEDEFSACKSANRALLSLSCGTPVIASHLKSLDPLKNCIVIDDWQSGFRRYLFDDKAAKTDLGNARAVLDSQFSAQATGQKWIDLIEAKLRPVVRKPRVTVLINLLQDIHVLQPLVELLASSSDQSLNTLEYELDVAVLKGVYLKQPSVVQDVIKTGANLRLLTGRTDDENLTLLNIGRSSLLIVGAETSLRPHKFVHAAALEANRLRIPTVSLQHGLEAPGLTFFDDVHSHSVTIASKVIFTYGDIAKLPVGTPSEAVSRCVAVGRFEPQPSSHGGRLAEHLSELNPRGLPVISIFENLHWHRYQPDSYRDRFTAYINRLASSFEDVFFIIKPHPAGVWLQSNSADVLDRQNILLLRRDDQSYSEITAADLIHASLGVITTPSTIVIDAAQLSRPVIIFGNTLQLPLFEPIEIARSYEDLSRFVEQISSGQGSLDVSVAFVSKILAVGDISSNIGREIRALLDVRRT